MSAEISSPRLLVSVRNLHEARIARNAGADLIDLKEPLRGSLGMAELPVSRQIAKEMPESQLSLALGELGDWNGLGDVPQIPARFRYLKLGLSQQASNPDWQAHWWNFRHSVDERAGNSFGWIAVVYADAEAAASPAPEVIIATARETNCAGVLFDTWSKSAGSLIDYCSAETLNSYIEAIHEAGILAALAGSVREEHLPALLPLGADVIAVRGAVCDRRNRTAKIDAGLIAHFKQQLQLSLGSPVK